MRKDQGFPLRAFRNAAFKKSSLVFIGSKFNPFSHSLQGDDAEHSLLNAIGTFIWRENFRGEETLFTFSTRDAFVLSFEREDRPIVLLEAMSFSRSWIARDSGCIS